MTTQTEAIAWLLEHFAADVDAAIEGTRIPRNLVFAVAMQETGYLWRPWIKSKTVDEILALSVGDTLDFPKRNAKAFPKNRADLESVPNGKAMFKLARAALVAIAKVNGGYAKVVKNPDKFCHGYGLFQYDLQFFKVDPDYFLREQWKTKAGTLKKCVEELVAAGKRTYKTGDSVFNHDQSVYVAIAYNSGSAKVGAGYKQGFPSDGKHYGEHIDAFLTAIETYRP